MSRPRSLTHQIEVPVPAAAAWAVVADYAKDPEWRHGVVSMTPSPDGTARTGTTTAEILRFGGRTMTNDGVVTAHEDGRSFSWRTTRGADADGARHVVPVDAGRSLVRLELTVRPRGAERLFAPVLVRMLDRTLRADLHRLRDLLTGPGGTRGPSPHGDVAQHHEFHREGEVSAGRGRAPAAR